MGQLDDQRKDNTYPDVEEIDDAIELFEILGNALRDKRQRRSIEIGIAALRCIKGSFYDK